MLSMMHLKYKSHQCVLLSALTMQRTFFPENYIAIEIYIFSNYSRIISILKYHAIHKFE